MVEFVVLAVPTESLASYIIEEKYFCLQHGGFSTVLFSDRIIINGF